MPPSGSRQSSSSSDRHLENSLSPRRPTSAESLRLFTRKLSLEPLSSVVKTCNKPWHLRSTECKLSPTKDTSTAAKAVGQRCVTSPGQRSVSPLPHQQEPQASIRMRPATSKNGDLVSPSQEMSKILTLQPIDLLRIPQLPPLLLHTAPTSASRASTDRDESAHSDTEVRTYPLSRSTRNHSSNSPALQTYHEKYQNHQVECPGETEYGNLSSENAIHGVGLVPSCEDTISSRRSTKNGKGYEDNCPAAQRSHGSDRSRTSPGHYRRRNNHHNIYLSNLDHENHQSGQWNEFNVLDDHSNPNASIRAQSGPTGLADPCEQPTLMALASTSSTYSGEDNVQTADRSERREATKYIMYPSRQCTTRGWDNEFLEQSGCQSSDQIHDTFQPVNGTCIRTQAESQTSLAISIATHGTCSHQRVDQSTLRTRTSVVDFGCNHQKSPDSIETTMMTAFQWSQRSPKLPAPSLTCPKLTSEKNMRQFDIEKACNKTDLSEASVKLSRITPSVLPLSFRTIDGGNDPQRVDCSTSPTSDVGSDFSSEGDSDVEVEKEGYETPMTSPASSPLKLNSRSPLRKAIVQLDGKGSSTDEDCIVSQLPSTGSVAIAVANESPADHSAGQTAIALTEPACSAHFDTERIVAEDDVTPLVPASPAKAASAFPFPTQEASVASSLSRTRLRHPSALLKHCERKATPRQRRLMTGGIHTPDRLVPSRAATPSKDALLLPSSTHTVGLSGKQVSSQGAVEDPFGPPPRRSLRMAEQYATVRHPSIVPRTAGMRASRVPDAANNAQRIASAATIWTVGGSVVTEGVASITDRRGGRVTSGSNATHYMADFLNKDLPSQAEVMHGQRLALAMDVDPGKKMMDQGLGHPSVDVSGNKSERTWRNGCWEVDGRCRGLSIPFPS